MAENILRTGTQYLKLTLKEFKDAKSRPILKSIDNYLHTISRNLNKLEFYDRELVYDAQKYYRNAAKQLSSVDKTLASLATETVQCVDYCKGLISNCHNIRDPFSLVQVKMKNLIDKSHAQLAGAIIQFGHIHEDINRILYKLDEIKTRAMKAQERQAALKPLLLMFIAIPLLPLLILFKDAHDALFKELFGKTENVTNLAGISSIITIILKSKIEPITVPHLIVTKVKNLALIVFKYLQF